MAEYYVIPYYGDFKLGRIQFVKGKNLDDVRQKILSIRSKNKGKKAYRVTIGISKKAPSGVLQFEKPNMPVWYPQKSNTGYLVDVWNGKLVRRL